MQPHADVPTLSLALVLVGKRAHWNSLGAVAGALEADQRFDSLALEFARPGAPALAALRRCLGRYAHVVAGYSVMTADLLWLQAEIANLRALREAEGWGGLTLVAGGSHATAAWRSTLALGFDHCLVGDAERAFPEFLFQLALGDPAPAVRGLASRRADGSLAWQGRAQSVALDAFPPFAPRFGHHGPIEITRGCRHRCRFCATPFLAGNRLRHRPLEAVVRAVESCLAHGVDQIRFVAPDGLAYGSEDGRPRLDRLEELLRVTSSLAGRDCTFLGSFPSEVRPEALTPRAVELIARYCGNDNLVIGAQSGSERMLQRMARGHTVADVLRAVEITQGAGLRANVDLILGLPGEIGEDRRQTLSLIETLAGRGARIHSHTFMPLPGAAWAHEPAGTVDRETEHLLGALALQGRQYGSWQKQARQARAWTTLLASFEAGRQWEAKS